MSGSGLTCDAQLRYILQWFEEFSELQKEDFLPVMKAARAGTKDDLVSALEALTCEDKPISLFQCRLKLFNEWYPTWSQSEQDRLMTGLSNIDNDFGAKLQELLANPEPVNGTANGIETNGVHTLEADSDDEGPKQVSDNPYAEKDCDPTKEEDIPPLDTVNETIPVEITAAS